MQLFELLQPASPVSASVTTGLPPLLPVVHSLGESSMTSTVFDDICFVEYLSKAALLGVSFKRFLGWVVTGVLVIHSSSTNLSGDDTVPMPGAIVAMWLEDDFTIRPASGSNCWFVNMVMWLPSANHIQISSAQPIVPTRYDGPC